jgi:hypothetical protein
VKLPAQRLALDAGETRSLKLRLPASARRSAGNGGRLKLDVKWSAGGSRGHSRTQRRLGH